MAGDEMKKIRTENGPHTHPLLLASVVGYDLGDGRDAARDRWSEPDLGAGNAQAENPCSIKIWLRPTFLGPLTWRDVTLWLQATAGGSGPAAVGGGKSTAARTWLLPVLDGGAGSSRTARLSRYRQGIVVITTESSQRYGLPVLCA